MSKVIETEVAAAVQAYSERMFYAADPLAMRAALEAAAAVREVFPGPLEVVFYGDAFQAFWNRYPNKVGKVAAIKAFAKACTRVRCDILMQGLERYCAKTDDRPWCNPATWLNQGRWEDQPVEVGNGTNRKGGASGITAAINAHLERAQYAEDRCDPVRQNTPRIVSEW